MQLYGTLDPNFSDANHQKRLDITEGRKIADYELLAKERMASTKPTGLVSYSARPKTVWPNIK